MKNKLLITSLFLLTSCNLAPTYERPVMTVPSNWSIEQVATEQITKDWWKKYNSAELDSLIELALTNNKELEAGTARIEQARAASKIAGSTLVPNVGASAGTNKNYTSEGRSSKSVDAGLDVGYEVDLFGRNRAGAEAAETREKATRYDYDSLALVVTSDTASFYADYLSLNDRLNIAKKNLENGNTILKIVQAKYDAGRISSLELSQQKVALANLQSSITNLESQRDIAKSQIAILTGQPPQNLVLKGESILELDVPTVKPIQPGELLEKRPDIKASEESLIAANIDIGAAKAEFYPSLQIGGSAGVAAAGFSNPATLAVNLLASLSQSIYSGGALDANLDQTVARKKELAANYSGLVLTAYKEVEDALSTVKATTESLASNETAKTESEKAYNIAKIRYDEGKTDFQVLLDTQNSFFSAEDNLYSAKTNAVKASVTLFKTLGGGWK